MAKGEKKTKQGAEAPSKGKGKGKAKGKAAEIVEKTVEQKAPERAPDPRIRTRYYEEVVPQLVERFRYKNPMEVPRLSKVVINMGVGEAVTNSKLIDNAAADLQIISGQRPSIRRARLSVSNFKLRQGNPVGAAVTLRRLRMWEFLERLLTFAIPRIRDFRGLPRRGFDGRGNFTFGLKEQLIFPEIEYDKIDQIRGMNITFVTTAETDEEALELLSNMGMPFERGSEQAA